MHIYYTLAEGTAETNIDDPTCIFILSKYGGCNT